MGLAAALWALGSIANYWLANGWMDSELTSRGMRNALREVYTWQIAVWLVAIAIWTATSTRLFRTPAPPNDDQGSTEP